MDDLELQRLKAVVDAVPAVLALLFAKDYGADGRVIELSDALDILEGRNISNEHPEYDDGPWAATGNWYPPGPSVSDRDEMKEPIRIAPLKQGFVVQGKDALGYEDDGVALTDRVDAAEWLLEWLGFDDEIVESVRDILAGLWDCDELVEMAVSWNDPEQRKPLEYERALDVAGAAWAYTESGDERDFIELVEAVKKWRGLDGEDLRVRDARISPLDIR